MSSCSLKAFSFLLAYCCVDSDLIKLGQASVQAVLSSKLSVCFAERSHVAEPIDAGNVATRIGIKDRLGLNPKGESAVSAVRGRVGLNLSGPTALAAMAVKNRLGVNTNGAPAAAIVMPSVRQSALSELRIENGIYNVI